MDNKIGEFLRSEGGEFGATTGRPRRCGWIDLPQLKYTIMLNGVTQLVVTKIDVLNNFETIQAGTHYQYHGEVHNQLPYDINNIKVVPLYRSHQGWQKSLEGVTEYDALPQEARDYIHSLEEDLGVPVTMVSTGPERKKLILKEVLVSQQ